MLGRGREIEASGAIGVQFLPGIFCAHGAPEGVTGPGSGWYGGSRRHLRGETRRACKCWTSASAPTACSPHARCSMLHHTLPLHGFLPLLHRPPSSNSAPGSWPPKPTIAGSGWAPRAAALAPAASQERGISNETWRGMVAQMGDCLRLRASHDVTRASSI